MKKPVPGTVGRRIRDARDEKQWTQRGLAKRLGHKDGQQVSRWERNEHEPTKDLHVLARVLNVSEQWILTGTEDEESSTPPPVVPAKPLASTEREPKTLTQFIQETPEGHEVTARERAWLRLLPVPLKGPKGFEYYVKALAAIRTQDEVNQWAMVVATKLTRATPSDPGEAVEFVLNMNIEGWKSDH